MQVISVAFRLDMFEIWELESTVEGFHTSFWKVSFFTSKSVLKGLKRLYAKNFIKIMKVEILVKIE